MQTARVAYHCTAYRAIYFHPTPLPYTPDELDEIERIGAQNGVIFVGQRHFEEERSNGWYRAHPTMRTICEKYNISRGL